MRLFRKKKSNQRSIDSIEKRDIKGSFDFDERIRRDAPLDLSQSWSSAPNIREAPSRDTASLNGSQHSGRVSTDSRSSTGLKLKLRKSFSNLFLEKNSTPKITSPRLSSEASSDRPRSLPALPTSEAPLKSPPTRHSESNQDWSLQQQELPPPTFFTLPSDAPPVPPSPTPEQLAFLESNKSRHSSSVHSVHSIPPSPRIPSLFERRDHRKSQLSLPSLDFAQSIHSGPPSASTTRPSFASSRETLHSVPPKSASVHSRSVSSKDGDDFSTETTSVWSNTLTRPTSFVAVSGFSKDESTDDSAYDSKDEDTVQRTTPEIEFKIKSERKIANARLCDVLRRLFGSNGRVGVDAACKEYLTNAKEPRMLEISMGVRTPMLASYADDYPHGKFYVTCVDRCENLSVETLDLPLESVVGGKESFSNLDFPDNFFDVVVSGSLQFILTKDEWPEFHAECYRILKPGGWMDILTTSAGFHSAGPITRSYESRLLSCLDRRNLHPNPGLIAPSILRTAGFSGITRTQILVPTFWREPKEKAVCIRNARTGEESWMTMSEMGDRVSTLMYGFWEEMFGEWDDDLEDFGERNRLRRKEAEEIKAWSLITKIGARKRQKVNGIPRRKQR